MKTLSKFSKFIPYIYFIAVVGYWFTDVNRTQGLTAFPILLFSIPFLWQIVKPNRKSNSTFKIVLTCLTLFLILTSVFGLSEISAVTNRTTDFVVYGGLFVISFSAIQLWVVMNSLRQRA